MNTYLQTKIRDLDTFPTPALLDYWPRDILADTTGGTNHYLQSIKEAVVNTSAAAGGLQFLTVVEIFLDAIASLPVWI